MIADQLSYSTTKGRSYAKNSDEETKVGGQETAPYEFGFIAYVQALFWNDDIANCTGTLIGERWVLSVARCTVAVGYCNL